MSGVDRRTLLASGLAAAAAPVAGTVPPPVWPPRETIALWPGTPPGAPATLPRERSERVGDALYRQLLLRDVARPSLAIFRPAQPNGTAVLVCPGGGYEVLAVENEGVDVGRALTALGYTVCVLSYRLPGGGWRDRADVPLQDAQRAMRLIAARAPDLRIDPARTGVMGFSAGGHVAASLATAHDERVYAATDAADRLPARPAFAALLYPVTTLRLPDTHAGSRAQLLGPTPDAATVDRRSPVLHVTAETPPAFLLHALDDTVVPPACSRLWVDASVAAKVPVEAHFIRSGGHGFGTGTRVPGEASRWPWAFAQWQKTVGG